MVECECLKVCVVRCHLLCLQVGICCKTGVNEVGEVYVVSLVDFIFPQVADFLKSE